MPQQLKSGQDVTALMSGQDVTDLMTQAAPKQLQIAPGTSPQEAIRQMKAFNESEGLTAQAESPSVLSSALSMGKGIAESLNPIEMVKGVYGAVRHPYDTLTGLVQAQGAQLSQAKALAKEGRYSEAAGYGLAGVLPLVGPAAAAVGENIGAGNVAEGVGQGLGLIGTVALPSVVKGASKAVSSATKATGAAEKGATIAERLAQEKFVRATAPHVGRNKVQFGNMAAKAAPEVLREPGMGALSRGGFAEKVGQRLEAAERSLDEAAASRPAGELVDTAPIVSSLKDRLKKLEAQTATGPEAHAQVEKLGISTLPARAPSSAMAFDDLPVPYKQELRRIVAELDEFQYQEGRKLDRVNEVAREGGYGSGRGARMRPSGYERDVSDPDYLPPVAGAEVYHEVLQGKTGTTRTAMMRSLRDYTEGKQRFTPIVQRAINVADQRLRNPDAVGRPLLPADAGFAAVDVAGPLGQSVVPGPLEPQAAVLRQVIREVEDLGPAASYDALLKIRQGWDQAAKAVYNPSMTADFLTKNSEKLGAADATGALREALGMIDPRTATANKEYALWKKMDDVLKAAEETDRVRPTVGRKIAARFAGAVAGGTAAGGPGAVIGAILAPLADSAMIGSPTTKILTARALTQLADALRKGDAVVAESTLKRLRALSLVGQARPKDQE